MEIREAILRAADWIEGHPEDFDFGMGDIPECGTPGCALGWISAFAGFKAPFRYTAAADALGLEPELFLGRHFFPLKAYAFYNRMSDLVPYEIWKRSAMMCARALRLYADRWHPSPVKEPDWNALALAPLPIAERHSEAA
jgi:hypothetical protein